MTEREKMRRQRHVLRNIVCVLAVVLCLLVAVVLLREGPQVPTLSTDPVQPQPSGESTLPSTEPTTVPPTTLPPTEPPLTYPPDATPQQKLEAFIEYHDLSLSDYPASIQAAFESSRENIDYLLNFPFLHDQQHEIDISGYDLSKGVPLFIQWDERWGYLEYGTSYAGLAACGPTCLSMVAYYLTGNARYDPVWMMDFAQANGYYMPGQGTAWTLFTEGAEKLGLKAESIYVTEAKLISTLKAGKLIIMSMKPGVFTTTGHLIVLAGYEDGYFIINDPNSYLNSQRKWSFEEFADQVKGIWSFGV